MGEEKNQLMADLLNPLNPECIKFILLYNDNTYIARKIHLFPSALDIIKVLKYAKNEGTKYVCYQLLNQYVAVLSTDKFGYIAVISIDTFRSLFISYISQPSYDRKRINDRKRIDDVELFVSKAKQYTDNPTLEKIRDYLNDSIDILLFLNIKH
jgi:hypothetical protein